MEQFHFNPEDDRFGSAGFAARHDLKRAGLINASGLPFGFADKDRLSLTGDAPLITFGGSGSGKLRDIIAYAVCDGPIDPMIYNDPRGEITAISWHTLAPRGIKGYFYDPYGLNPYASHSCNVYDILKPGCPRLDANASALMAALLPLSGSSAGSDYFEQTAQRWLKNLSLWRVERNGVVSLPDLYRCVSIIESDVEGWIANLEEMQASPTLEVRQCAGEMLFKQTEAPREFSGVMGEINNALAPLSDPLVRASLEDGFSISELIMPRSAAGSVRMGLLIPQEYLAKLAPVTRCFFEAARLYKAGAPSAKHLTMLIDEAPTLGRFKALEELYGYGRGSGIRTWSFWQNIMHDAHHLILYLMPHL